MISNVFLYWSVLLAGILVGTYIKKKRAGRAPKWFRVLGPLQTAALGALIFVLGMGIGPDEQVVSSLSEIGFSAVVIALSCLAGSIFLTWVGRKLTGLDREGRLPGMDPAAAAASADPKAVDGDD